MSHAALVRGEDGGLAVRRFARAEDAQAHSDQREVAPERPATRYAKADWTTGDLAKLLGVSQRTIIRRCELDLLPFVDHGTATQPRRRFTAETIRLIRRHGLGGVARMRQAGQL